MMVSHGPGASTRSTKQLPSRRTFFVTFAGALLAGCAVTVLGAQAGHYKILLGDGKTGFVTKRAVAWVSGL